MTDIVERLRFIVTPADGRPHIIEMCAEAAAEIVRLRRVLASWQANAALARGSMAPAPEPDEPAQITDAAPNAPR